MATTEHFYTGNNSTTDYSFTFPYLKTDNIKVTLDTVATTAFTLPNSTTVRFNTAPGQDVDIHIYRETDVDPALATFIAGSSIRAVDLNNNFDRALYALQEHQGQLVKTTDIKDSAITSAKLLDGTIVNNDINGSAAIAGTKVSPDFGSQNVATTGTINSLSTTELAILDGATLSTNELNILDGVTATTAELNIMDGVTATTAELNIVDGVTATTAELNIMDGVTATTAELNLMDGVTATTAELNYVDGVTSNVQTQLDAKQSLDNELSTLAGMQSGTASKLAGGTALTSDIADLNQVDGLTKQTTISDSDASFPTSGAVVDYVTAQIAPIGGLEVIANDASFPNAQPQAGVVISIADAGGLVVDGSGESSTARTVGGTTVTINGINSSYNSSTVTDGIGFLVSSTGTGQVYNFHKSVIRDQDILSISTDINDFANRYRVGSSNPAGTQDSGDLFFNTTTAKLLVYNGSSGAWEEAQSVGNFFINTISSYSGTGGNSATFNGTAYRFVLSNPPANAQQLLVSINGVVQKPNANQIQPSEGFAIDGSSIIFSDPPASGSDYFIITVGSTVNIGTPSTDTVGVDELKSGAVTDAKVNASANIAGSKLADDSIAEVKLDVHNAPSGTDKFLAYTSNGMEWAVPTTISFANDANNRVVTGTGSGLNGEVSLTFDAGLLKIDDLSGTAGKGRLEFGNSGEQYIEGYDTGNGGSGSYLSFGDGSAEYLRIDTSGRLLLGAGSVSLPKGSAAGSFDLDNGNITMCIGGNQNSTGRTNSTDKINRVTSPHYTNAEEPVAIYSSYNVSNQNVISYGGGSSQTNSVTKHSFYTAADTTTTTGTERMRIQSDGNVKINDGDLQIGTAGHGIDFSAQTASSTGTTGAETIDHYEEGVFSPAADLGTFTTNLAAYTRIGRIVIYSIYGSFSTNTSSSVQALGNFPFAVLTNSYHSCAVNSDIGGGHHPVGQFQASDGKLRFKSTSNAQFTGEDMSGHFVVISGVYQTT